jgi:hypothetical protein
MGGRTVIDIAGQIFGRLCVLEFSKSKNRVSYWICQCECGNKKEICGNSLKRGLTRSCGCLNREIITKHGAGRDNANHPLYSIWRSMKARCYNSNNPRYEDYGGRGITVYKEWLKDYTAFRDYMLTLPECPKNAEIPGSLLNRSIDRIRNNEGYKPGNMKWSTVSEQNCNQRRNRIVVINGVSMSLKPATDKYAVVDYETVRRRMDAGWTTRNAFLTPKRV